MSTVPLVGDADLDDLEDRRANIAFRRLDVPIHRVHPIRPVLGNLGRSTAI